MSKNITWLACYGVSFLGAAALAGTSMEMSEKGAKTHAIHIVGSSTVYPFSASAAEQFGEIGEYPTPVVEQTGTGGGINIFCSGEGPETPDMVNASRPIKPEERERCATNGIADVTEITIGYDGIVLAIAKESEKMVLSEKDIFLALAKDVVVDGKLTSNPYHSWKEVNPQLPDRKIEIYGPPHTSGTRDAFEEIVMEKACKAYPEFAAAYTDKDEYKSRCRALREDGVFVEQGENDNVIVQKLQANPTALGIFGYAFLDENRDKINGVPIEGAEPTFENIADGSYPVARSLYVYVKDSHIGQVPGMVEYLEELTSPEAMGDDGYLALEGLIPLPEVLQEQSRAKVASLGKSAEHAPESVTQ